MELHEECGVFGVYDPAGDCARTAYYGLYALQHRGQEACGIAAINDRELSFHKDVGLVGDVFHEAVLDRLNGTMAVGHVRYSTTGGTRRENAQPLTLRYVKGTLALAHNGNLPHADQLRTQFEYQGAIFQTTSDSELIAYAIAQARLRCPSVEEAVRRALAGLRGAWSLIVQGAALGGEHHDLSPARSWRWRTGRCALSSLHRRAADTCAFLSTSTLPGPTPPSAARASIRPGFGRGGSWPKSTRRRPMW